MSTDTRKTCTCIGTCRGAAGLGEGWSCAMESPPVTPSSAAAERCPEKCPKCGEDPCHVKPWGTMYGCMSWFFLDSEFGPSGLRQEPPCRIRELEQQLAAVTAERDREHKAALEAECRRFAMMVGRDEFAQQLQLMRRAAADDEAKAANEIDAAHARAENAERELKEAQERVAKLERIGRAAFNSVETNWVRLHECPRKQELAALLVEMQELGLSRSRNA